MKKKRILKLSAVAITALTLMSCSSKNGIYLNILQFPGTIFGYDMNCSLPIDKKKKIEEYTKIHYEELREEVKEKKGKHLEQILKLADIKESKYPNVKAQLHKEHNAIFHNTKRITEELVQNISKLYLSKEKSKTINGFSYTELYDSIEVYVEEHFEEIRLAVKSGKSEVFIPLSKKVNIKDKKKEETFINSLSGKHIQLYDDLLVLSIIMYKM